MPDAFDHCEALVREADRDRFLAALFAPAKCRPALFALYAFNVEVSRVRDLAREPLPGEIRLQWWRDIFDGLRDTEAKAHPVAAAILDTITHYRLPKPAFADFIDAHTFDLYDEPMRTVADLEAYVGKTSSTVMRLAAVVLNDGHETGVDAAIDRLGIAQAFTGVMATLPLHAARRQLYIPVDLLRQHGGSPEDVFAGRGTEELRRTLWDLRRRARSYVAEAKPLLAAMPEAVAPALLPAALITPTLNRMERPSCDPFRPALLPQWRRQWILWRAARRGLQRAL